MTTMIIIRHAETEGNISKIWQGSTDAPLTRCGQRQVSATADYLCTLTSDYPLNAFYVSPLPRARTTAGAITARIGYAAQVDDGLREFDLGEWEGRSFQDLRESEDLWGRWALDPGFAPPGGESPRLFSRRAVDTMEKLTNRHLDQTLLVVTHGALISSVLANWLGDGAQDWRRWEVHNCAISIIQHDGETWQPIVFDYTEHLPQDCGGPER